MSKPSEDLFTKLIKIHFGLYTDNLKAGRNIVKDIKFIPISINYDVIHEARSFPSELLGEKPQKETFFKLIKKFSLVAK